MEAKFGLIEWAIIALIAGIILVILAGCGSSTDRQTKIVERQEWVLGPMVVDTPVGQIVMQPTRTMHQRTQDEVEKVERTVNMPDPTPIITAATGGGLGPLGIAGTLLGVITTTAAAWKAKQMSQQRDEVIAGVERAKGELPPEQWETLTASLEKEQSRDTKAAVKARVG